MGFIRFGWRQETRNPADTKRDCVARRENPSVKADSRLTAIFAAFGAALLLNGCNKLSPVPPAPPPPAVNVAKPLIQDVMEWDTFTGNLEAKESVNVSARVSGLIMEAPFVEGSIVKKSQVLYLLDESPFQADLDSKVANAEKAKAQLAVAYLNFQRAEDAIARGASSKQEYDTAKSEYHGAQASLDSANASVRTARLNLEWCRVKAPIEGRVGRKMVTAGNLIIAGGGLAQPTLLTTIQSVTPIYCNIDVDERTVQKYQRLASEKKRVHERDGTVPCYARLSDEAGFPHVGYIDFVDNRIDSTTGTQRMRGLLPNESGRLTPGNYATLRIPGSGRYRAMLVPDAAIGNDQSHRTVLVVNAENIVEVRIVEIGALFNNMRAIVSGLSPNERVIVNGQMKAFPDTPVTPTEITLTPVPSDDPMGTAAAGQPAPVVASPSASGKTP